MGIPWAVTDLSGAPVNPSPQAFSILVKATVPSAAIVEAESATAIGELESSSYGKLKGMAGGEKHHIPSNLSMNEVSVTRSQGTAINTEKSLHRGLPNTGSSDVAKAFRAKESEFLKVAIMKEHGI